MMPKHGRQMRELVAKEPDLTLEEIKRRLGLECTVAAIHWVLAKMGLTYKKDAPCGRAEPSRCCESPALLAAEPRRNRPG